MREQIGKAVKANEGDLVSLDCRLADGQDYARLYLWSAGPGEDFSPHVPYSQLDMATEDGKPHMHAPTSIRLNSVTPAKQLEFFAERNLRFCIRQEKDVASDTSAIVKVKRYGKIALSLRRRCRNIIGLVRRIAGRPLRDV
jgi:hypothetical protein